MPSLAERWEISDDGLRYVFHLREGLRWSDGEPLTAHDVEFGIKRVLNPAAPGSSVAIYFVLENGQDYYLGKNDDADAIGVRALDDRTVEFRLAAPAPYFMSVMNRPDGGPQPRHAIERDGDAWIELGKQVVSGAFRIAERSDEVLVLERRSEDAAHRPGNAARLEFIHAEVEDALEPYLRDELDIVTVRYTPKLADLVPHMATDASLGQAAWSAYIAFDHSDPVLSNVEFRRALAHALDRDALEAEVPEQPHRRARWDRAARAPGTHARHRAGVRSGRRTGRLRTIGRGRGPSGDRRLLHVGPSVPRDRDRACGATSSGSRARSSRGRSSRR